MTDQPEPQWQRIRQDQPFPFGIPTETFLGGLRVSSRTTGQEMWEIYLAQYDLETGDLHDPESGDAIGWNLTDLEAWCPVPADPAKEFFQ
jgi:hypothetical protein